MLTLSKVQKEITTLLQTPKPKDSDDVSQKIYKRAQKRVADLNWMRDYLSNNPSEDYLERDIEKPEARLNAISDGFQLWYQNNQSAIPKSKNPHTMYESIMDVSTIKRHLRNAKILLNK